MATPHISASPGQIAPAVLMPGDPLRAERIAKQLMPDCERVSYVRGNGIYTGEVNGKPLSVMASGMGQPSLTIYANELFSQYGVERIIRVGTAGGIDHGVEVGDAVIALGAHTDSGMNTSRIPGIHFCAVASYELVAAAVAASREDGAQAEGKIHVGPIVSRDHFYGTDPAQTTLLAKYGALCVEMEAAALYAVAAEYHKQALAVLTISDHLLDPSKDMTPEERETKFGTALKLAVAAAHC